MTDSNDSLLTTDASLESGSQVIKFTPAAADQSDRRRPGRMAIAPELIPLLREVRDEGLVNDDLAPARGIALAVALSAPIYLALWFGVRRLFF